MSRAGSGRGFSIAEMLVAMLLVSFVLVAAGSIFSAIGRRADRESGRAPGIGGPTDVALDRLERDLQLAESFPARSGPLRADARTLLIETQDGSLVTWRQQGSRLLRGTEDERHRIVERLVADQMLTFDVQPRSLVLRDVALRRRGEPLRLRTVLLRNHDPRDEAGP